MMPFDFGDADAGDRSYSRPVMPSTPSPLLPGARGLIRQSSMHLQQAPPLSPVGGFSRSPWSPTVEESKQLGMGLAGGGSPNAQTQAALSRGGSVSVRGRHGGGGRYGEEVLRLGEELSNLGVTEEVDQQSPTSSVASLPPVSPPPKQFLPPSRAPVRSKTISAATSARGRLPPLMTNPDVLASLSTTPPADSSNETFPPSSSMNARSKAFIARQGPASAAAYVPPIGHSHHITSVLDGEGVPRGTMTAFPGSNSAEQWSLQKEMLLGSSKSSAAPSTSNAAVSNAGPASAAPFATAVGVNPLPESWPAGGGFGVGLAMAQQQQIQLLQSQMQQAMQVMESLKAQGHPIPPGFPTMSSTSSQAASTIPIATPSPPPSLAQQQLAQAAPRMQALAPGFNQSGLMPSPMPEGPSSAVAESPIDVPTLIANKGYNPVTFDLRPPFARFFVIKSYTEEDIYKSLKYEIWASTDLGNKRLDRAFRESADKGPIYLFFSVNGSGHFAGIAQMLTPVDYAMSSNVWASDKWKGILKVRWIYIKDVPLSNLRHIRLSNTPENKPVTSSRDTQEVPYSAGLEVLKIISSYPSRTSLLQDYGWYEARTANGNPNAASAAPHESHYAQVQQQQQQQQQQHQPSRPPPPPQQQQQQQQHYQPHAQAYQQPYYQPPPHSQPPYPYHGSPGANGRFGHNVLGSTS